jgi:hypothetical protein
MAFPPERAAALGRSANRRGALQITVSVFATRDELRDWLAYQAGRFDLHFALVRYRPQFEVVPLAAWSAFDQHKGDEQWQEVWADLRPVRHRCKGQIDCCSQNPDRLALQLPDMRPEGLREGSLGTVSEDAPHLRAWRAVIRYFRKQTTAGMWVHNPSSGARGFYKHLRYSAGIAELHRQGLQLLPFAGGNRVLIEEPGAEQVASADRPRDNR